MLVARYAFFSFKRLATLPGKDGREEAMKRREKVKFEVKAEVEGVVPCWPIVYACGEKQKRRYPLSLFFCSQFSFGRLSRHFGIAVQP